MVKGKQISHIKLQPAMSKRKLVTLLVSTILLTVLVTGFFVYTVANPSIASLYAEEGIYPGTPTYTIWQEDSTYYAKNRFGHIDYLGSSGNDVIQDALDATGADGGGRVLCTEGLYIFTLQGSGDWKYCLKISYSNIVLAGQGFGTIFQLADSQTANGDWDCIIRIGENDTTYENIVVENLQIDGNAEEQSTGLKGIVFQKNTIHSTVRNCLLVDINIDSYTWSGTIFGRTGSSWNKIQNNIIQGGGHSGCYIEASSYYDISHNWMNYCRGEGIGVFNCQHLTISDNIVIQTQQGHGCYIAQCKHVTVTGNIFRDCVNGEGIQFSAGSGIATERISIQSNVVMNNSAGGIYIQSAGNVKNSHILIDGNVVGENGGDPEVMGDGINIFYWDGASITNNVVFENWGHGIAVTGKGKDIVVSDNVVQDNAIYTGAVRDGIYVSDAETGRVVISNNIIANTTEGGWQEAGIWIKDTIEDEVIITGNMISNQHHSGIIVSSVDNMTITGNSCIDSATYDGIRVSNCENLVIVGNKCTGNDDYGINEIGTADYNIILGNNCRDNGIGSIVVVGANTINQHNLP